MIDKLQNYYGIAIRSNIGDLSGMKKAVHATTVRLDTQSWCGFQQDRNTFKHGPGLPDAAIRLSEDTLLNKCLHGKTQNQNEAVNGMVWEQIPKGVFVGTDLLEFGLFDAINHF